MSAARWMDWFRQGSAQLQWAQDAYDREQYALVCFLCQQSAEMFLKALAYFRGAEVARGHSLLQLSRELQIDSELEKAAMRLDQYYISTRYPDSYAAGSPYEFFTEDQAAEAMQLAMMFSDSVASETSA